MKSPTSKVGIIEPEGILKGSTRKERNRNTSRMIGKKLLGYSTHQGSLASGPRRLRSTRISSSQTAPVTSSRTSMSNAKFIGGSPCCRDRVPSLVFHLQDSEESLLRYFHRANLLHALLARFLLFQQFFLARDVAAVALRQHVLAQRLHGFARDDVRADRGLHGDIEHLPWNEFAHARRKLAPTVLAVGAMHDQR